MSKNITIHLGGWPLLVTIVLCTLKLTGIINISWWWCFCLFWLPFALLFAFIAGITVLIVVFLLISWFIELINDRL